MELIKKIMKKIWAAIPQIYLKNPFESMPIAKAHGRGNGFGNVPCQQILAIGTVFFFLKDSNDVVLLSIYCTIVQGDYP